VHKKTISLIGCGRVGTAIASGLQRAGFQVIGIADTDSQVQRSAGRRLRIRPGKSLPVTHADIVLIATPDSQIGIAYRQIADLLRPGQTVVHFSGALDTSVFRGARRKGLSVLALHPVMTFPTRSSWFVARGSSNEQRRPGRWRSHTTSHYFSLEGNAQGVRIGRAVVRALGGKAFVLRPQDKPLFHIACVFASNFLNVVVDAALQLMPARRFSYTVFAPLIRQTLESIAGQGSVRALTGPIERGDIATVKKHLMVLTRRGPRFTRLYRVLSQAALALARKKGSISRPTSQQLEDLLRTRLRARRNNETADQR
jgi:predicted short-subunit dehydrogenase-like oxidoreductase (DUF2520 family)